MATVRVDDDLNEALKAAAVKANLSVTKYVNAALRRDLTGPPRRPAPDVPPSVRPKVIRGGRREAPTEKCPHPPGRRLGNQCAACGAVMR